MNLKATLKKFKILEGTFCLGNLSRILNFTDEPRFCQFYCSAIGANSCGEQLGSAALAFNEDTAKVRALGEYIERYCLETISQELNVLPFNNVSSSALDPAQFINFRDEDLDFRKEEYIKRIRQTLISWVTGTNLKDKKTTLIPAQLVYVGTRLDEPLIRPQISTGAAAHEVREKATLNGILECVERDAFMLRYLAGDAVPQIKLEGRLKELKDYFERYKLELKIYDITTDLGIPSFMSVNIDRTGIGPAVSVGLKSGLVPEEAIYGAIIESQQVRQWIRFLFVQDRSPKIALSEIDSIKKRGYFWYNVDMINKLDFLNGPFERTKPSKLNNLEDTLNHLADKGISIYEVDITAPQVRDAGFNVIKAVVPKLHPLFLDERYPCFYSERLESHLNGRKINSLPHPFM